MRLGDGFVRRAEFHEEYDADYRFVGLAATSALQAQTALHHDIPIRLLATPTAKTPSVIGGIAGIKQLPDGRLLVNDPVRRRILLFDRALTTYALTADSGGASGATYPQHAPRGLYQYLGDSTLIVDWDSRTFLVVGPTGRIERALAHPRPLDLGYIDQPWLGTVGADLHGRFIYRAGGQARSPAPAASGGLPASHASRDTVPIVRVDFDTRAVDTIGQVTIPRSYQTQITRASDGKASAAKMMNPLPEASDEWAVLPNGTVAIVRARDYHVDWIYPDGKTASTPKMAFDWRRLSDADKQAKVDSARKIMDSVTASRSPDAMILTGKPGGGVDTLFPRIEFVSLAEIPDYVPPIRSGAVRPDADGNVWILPTTSVDAKNGLLYDIVNAKGEVFERVQLPAGRDIAGFGRGGVVYLSVGDRKNGFAVERSKVVRDRPK